MNKPSTVIYWKCDKCEYWSAACLKRSIDDIITYNECGGQGWNINKLCPDQEWIEISESDLTLELL